jgi:flagellar FliL protein
MATKAKTEEAAGEEAVAPPKSKKSSLKWIVVGAVALAIIGGGGAFAWFKFMTPHRTEAKSGEAKQADGKTEGKGSEKSGEPGASTKLGPILDLDPFIVNLADMEPRFLKVTVKLELDTTVAKTELNERIPQIRDSILILLSSKESQSLKPTAGKLQLRDEILQRINSLLANGQAKNAYFTEFVVQ